MQIKNVTLFSIITLASLVLSISLSGCHKSNEATPSTVGKGGSLARFTIVGDYLYTVDNKSINAFYLASNPLEPTLVSNTEIGMDIETIFSYNNILFIGSMDAMYIFSLVDPAHPKREGMANHFRSCDPVVANDSVAFVTLRTSGNCGGDRSVLDIFDITDITRPITLSGLEMKEPYGLGLKDEILYVCDDELGLQIINVSDPRHPLVLRSIKDYRFRDCIPYEDILICMVTDGMVIYDINDESNPIFVTKVN